MEADDGRLALQAIRESRETLGGIFALVIKNAESGGLGGFSDAELEAEVKRRGLDKVIEMRLITIGNPPLHEWEELPESATAYLPGHPEGRLYLCRKHVRQPKGHD
ncbi:MAG: hypothetical protein LAO31_19935 [Acidobacteriia bacterium]|nr:hypothetical protein [Terriglobia bacterium]